MRCVLVKLQCWGSGIKFSMMFLKDRSNSRLHIVLRISGSKPEYFFYEFYLFRHTNRDRYLQILAFEITGRKLGLEAKLRCIAS